MTYRNTLFRLIPVVSLSLAACTTAYGQANGSLVGTVTDVTGSGVPNANVTYTNTATNQAASAKSDASGNYQFLNLIPGMYKVTVEGDGFKQFLRQNVEVTVGNATRIDVAMQLGGVTETVEVTTESPLVSTQSSSLNYEVGQKQVDNLPLNGRNVMNLTALVPGVVPQGNTQNANASTTNVNGWGNYQIGGGAANQSQTLIDGAPVNISYTNSTSLVPTQDVIQEFQVATNNVSPEFGRFAGGVVNMATKPGTNALHGTVYEYYRNNVLNANLYFNKHTPTNLIDRPLYTQHQFGAAVGGPIKKDKTFFFLSWEQFSLRQATTTSTLVPTQAMNTGDFSQVCSEGFNGSGICSNPAHQIYAPGTGAPYLNNNIAGSINPSALAISKLIFPQYTTNGFITTNNFIVSVPKTTVYNQYNARVDHQLNDKNQLFARFTNWHKNASGSSALLNQIGNNAYFGTIQAVVGDSFILKDNLVGSVRASYLRFINNSKPFLCCSYNLGNFGGNWASYQTQTQFAQAPQPNIAGFNNFSTGATIADTDNTYAVSGSLTWTVGRHSIQYGGESRRIEWGYVQTNSPAGTFTASASTTAATAATTTPGAVAGAGGYSYASWLLGRVTAGSAQEPAKSFGTQYYSGAFIADAFRVTNKLTINAGLRWEQPGAFHERNGNLSVLDLTKSTNLPSANGGPTVGGLDLVSSSLYGSRDWQKLHWLLFSPRVGFAFSPDSKSVLKGGFGISYLPNTVAFSLGPYNNPPNSATTTVNPAAVTLSNPFPNGLLQPSGRSQAGLDALIGQGIQSPLPNRTYPYTQQWNLGIQHQFGTSTVLDVGYVGTHGVALPLYSINHDQVPDQYIAQYASATAAITPAQCHFYQAVGTKCSDGTVATGVPNPFYGIISPTSPEGTQMIAPAYLTKPFPQYQYVTEDAAPVGNSSYQALQVRLQERLKAAGVLLVSYTHAHLEGTADTLTGYLETSRFGVGGASGVQDNYNLGAEYSKSSFDVPDRAVISYTLALPFGHGQKFLGTSNGFVDRLAGGWTVNGIFTFQTGFPIAFQNSAANTLQANFAAGNAGPGLPAGVTRPNFVPGNVTSTGAMCNNTKTVSGGWKANLAKAFNTACFTVPNAYSFGSEARVDSTLRAEGQDNFDLSLAKKVQFTERYGFEFRAESFNLFNRTQFSPPSAQADTSTYGQVTAQVNQPRILQLSGRVNF